VVARYPLPEFVIVLGPAVIAGGRLRGIGYGRCGRKVRLKIGDMEAEGRTVEEIERLLRQASLPRCHWSRRLMDAFSISETFGLMMNQAARRR
jgi:hypothetical protein